MKIVIFVKNPPSPPRAPSLPPPLATPLYPPPPPPVLYTHTHTHSHLPLPLFHHRLQQLLPSVGTHGWLKPGRQSSRGCRQCLLAKPGPSSSGPGRVRNWIHLWTGGGGGVGGDQERGRGDPGGRRFGEQHKYE